MRQKDFLMLIVLDGIKRINGQRSVQGLANVLAGRKNHQTWTDIHLFQLNTIYRFFRGDHSRLLEETLHHLKEQRYIIENKNGTLRITRNGEEFHNLFQHILSNSGVRDGRVIDAMEMFWNRLHLLIQTCSHLLHHEHHFLPIIRDPEVQQWVKDWINQKMLSSRIKALHEEMRVMLNRLSDPHKELALKRLSGVHRTAYTLHQAAKERNIPALQMKWEWEVLLSHLFYIVNEHKFTVLPSIHLLDCFISKSAQLTRRLLKQGRTIDEISMIRGLKASTVMDHIVEIALFEPDSIVPLFLSREDEEKIHKLIIDTNRQRLSEIKEKIPHVSYFQIRLALISLKEGHGSANAHNLA